jgi:hypothetical protein
MIWFHLGEGLRQHPPIDPVRIRADDEEGHCHLATIRKPVEMNLPLKL